MTEITLEMMRKHLYSAVVCDALDSVGLRNQSPRVQLPSYSTSGLLVGRCKTTLWVNMHDVDPKPYELELKAVDNSGPESVMICAAHGSNHSALWGELLSTASINAGCVGAIVDGMVRDVDKIRQMNFPVFAKGTSPYDSKDRQRVVDLDVVVEIGSVPFSPGDLVFADTDGIVVVPKDAEEEVIQLAWDKANTENEVRDAIKNGMKATEAFEKYGVL